MAYKKITADDLAGKGVVGQPDVPGLSAREMQLAVEEIARDVIIPAFNSFVDDVTERDGNVYTKEETKEYINANVGEGITTYTHSSSGLSGKGANGKFKCTASGTVSSIKVNGVNYSVNCAGETSMELVAGAWYTFVLDGTTINFRSGGGINSKLAAATASAEDVAAGKTFYSGNSTLKTGTMPTYTQKQAGSVYDSGQQGALFFRNIPEGYYAGGGTQYPYRPEVFAEYGAIASAIGLTPEKLLTGNTVIGVVGTGTGSELNYTVVASASQPSNPAPNTIWVKSSVPMTQYTMRGIAPSFSTSNGYVYIQYEGSGSTNATLNLIKSNSIYVKITKVYQWQDGAWKSMEASIYQNGQWVSISQAIVQIYPGTSVTTMFTANTGVISGFKISRTANQEGYGMCYIPIDLTGVKNLHIEGSIQSFCGVCLSDKLPQANANPGALSVASQNSSTGYKHDNIWQKTNWAEDTTVTTVNIDDDVPVTNYSGTYYLILALYGSHVGMGATVAQITKVTKE